MLHNQSSLQQIRIHLKQDLQRIYPEGEAESLIRLILNHLGFTISDLIIHPNQIPGSIITAQINEIVAEIHTHKPIQYILGTVHFCELKLKVSDNVLIPRGETEELVHRIIEDTQCQPEKILDIGTGSGCIALALKNRFKDAKVYGMDHNQAALEVAKENGRSTELDVNWIPGDILKSPVWHPNEKFDLIVSNPPYVKEEERKKMHVNVLHYEPQGAIFADQDDPLLHYQHIAAYAAKELNETGFLWVEINEGLGPETANIIQKAGFREVSILKDMHDKDRFIRAS